MTIRSYMNRRKRLLVAVFSAGFAIFVLGAIVLGKVNQLGAGFEIAGAVGFGCAFLAVAYGLTFGFLCPNCRARWRHIAMSYGLFSIDRSIKYCPYCGVAVDIDLPADRPTNSIPEEPRA